MPGLIVFDPDNDEVGLSTGDDLALNSFQDKRTDTLYFTDGLNIYEWGGDAVNRQEYTWRSGQIRLPSPVNLGAAIVEAPDYTGSGENITFRLYADGELKHTEVVADEEPFRLPGGYLSNLYEVEIVSTLPVTRLSVAESIFELLEG